MESPGEFLKRERELRGVDLPHIADSTRVPLVQLEALEADDYERLPHPVYVRGFIRAYCKCLGLDEGDAVLRYEAYIEDHAPADAGGGVEAAGETAVSPAAVATVLVVAGVIAVIVFFIFRGDGSSGGVALKGEPGVVDVKTAMAPAARAAAVEGAAVPEGADDGGAGEVAADKAAATEKSGKEDKKGKKHDLFVWAVNDTWMRVSIDDGDPFEVMLKSGDSVRWTGDEVFFYLLETGPGYSSPLTV